MMGKWWWRFKTLGDVLWVRVIKSIYGLEGGLSLGEGEGGRVRSIWGGIIGVGCEMEMLGLGCAAGFQKKIGNGESTLFWKECWVGEMSFECRFPRLFRLERIKDVRVCERRCEDSNGIRWSWDWAHTPRGRALSELEDLIRIVEIVPLCADKEDVWRWVYDSKGEFSVGSLRRMIEDKILVAHSIVNSSPTVWNRLLPKKVCIFIWRAMKDRMPVRVSLDNRGIDLGSTLCPRCGIEPESLLHCLIQCPHSMAIWNEVFAWWGWSGLTACPVIDLLMHKGHLTFSAGVASVWQAVLWVSSYLIWKNRNDWVFRKKSSCASMLPMLIKIYAFNWISRRWKYGALDWQVWNVDPVAASSKLLMS